MVKERSRRRSGVEKARDKPLTPLQNVERQRKEYKEKMDRYAKTAPGSETHLHYRSAYKSEVAAGHAQKFFNNRGRYEQAVESGDKKAAKQYKAKMEKYQQKWAISKEKANRASEEYRSLKRNKTQKDDSVYY